MTQFKNYLKQKHLDYLDHKFIYIGENNLYGEPVENETPKTGEEIVRFMEKFQDESPLLVMPWLGVDDEDEEGFYFNGGDIYWWDGDSSLIWQQVKKY